MFQEQKSFTRVTMVGPGMATTSVAVCDHLRTPGSKPKVIDIGAPSLDRTILVRLKRIAKILRSLMRFAYMRGLSGAVRKFNETEQREPDFSIVGTPKAGTTSLYNYPIQHSDIFMPEHKEPHLVGGSAFREPASEQSHD